MVSDAQLRPAAEAATRRSLGVMMMLNVVADAAASIHVDAAEKPQGRAAARAPRRRARECESSSPAGRLKCAELKRGLLRCASPALQRRGCIAEIKRRPSRARPRKPADGPRRRPPTIEILADQAAAMAAADILHARGQQAERGGRGLRSVDASADSRPRRARATKMKQPSSPGEHGQPRGRGAATGRATRRKREHKSSSEPLRGDGAAEASRQRSRLHHANVSAAGSGRRHSTRGKIRRFAAFPGRR